MQGAPADAIDLRDWYPHETEGINAMPVGGYHQFVRRLAAGLDIRLQTPVGVIAHGPGGVTAHTSQGPLRAAAAVVTVPLGILKSGRLLFDPPLSTAKRAAMERIGYGGAAVMNKLFLRFPRQFWPDIQDRLVGLPPTPAERGAFSNWVNVQPLVEQPVLLGFVSGRLAAELDLSAADDYIVNLGLASLRRMFGSRIPDPTGYCLTRWLSDPWALGSYSYAHTASTGQDRRHYAAPVGGRLFFAGEAATAADYGTVHAALLTGERAAIEVHAQFCCGQGTVAHLPYAGWAR